MAKCCTSTLELRGKCSRLQKIGENSQRYLKAGLIIRGMTAQRGVSKEEGHVEVVQFQYTHSSSKIILDVLSVRFGVTNDQATFR
jgi:hypothetical protein